MFVTQVSNIKRLATGKAARRLVGMAAVGLAASAAAQQAVAATFTPSYQNVYVSGTISPDQGPGNFLSTHGNGPGNSTGSAYNPTLNVVYSTSSASGYNQTTPAQAITSPTEALTITVHPGQYIGFDVGAAVTNNPNIASKLVSGGTGASKYDTVKHGTFPAGSEPATLGATQAFFVISTPSGTNTAQGLQPLYMSQLVGGNPPPRSNAGVDNYGLNSPLANAAFVDPGDVQGGEIGALNQPGGGSSSAVDAYKSSGNINWFTTDANGTGSDAGDSGNNILQQVAFQVATNVSVTTTVPISVTSVSVSFAEYAAGGMSTSQEPSFRCVPSASTDTVNNLPNLTVVIQVPEPASIGLIGAAATLVLGRRRRAKKA